MDQENQIDTLIVDKNPMNAGLLLAILKQLDCHPAIASSTEDAIGELAQVKPRFVFINSDSKEIDIEQVILFAANNQDTKIFLLTSSEKTIDNSYISGVIKIPVTKDKIENVLTKKAVIKKALEEKMLQSIKDLAGDDDPDFLPNLINMFFSRAPDLMVEIEKGINTNDAYKLERSAHSLKGSCGNLGAVTMMKICEKLEHMGREKKMEGSLQLLEELKSAYKDAKGALEKDWMPKAS